MSEPAAPRAADPPPRVDKPPRRFVFVCYDGPEAASRRSAAIAAHARYMEAVWRETRLLGYTPALGTWIGGRIWD